jgi:hypothetical protein
MKDNSKTEKKYYEIRIKLLLILYQNLMVLQMDRVIIYTIYKYLGKYLSNAFRISEP